MFATAFLTSDGDVELNRRFRIRQISADGGDDFVRKRIFFRIKDCADVLQILRRKITNKFLTKDVCDCRILYILKDSSVRGKYGRRVLLIIITAFGQLLIVFLSPPLN